MYFSFMLELNGTGLVSQGDRLSLEQMHDTFARIDLVVEKVHTNTSIEQWRRILSNVSIGQREALVRPTELE